MPFVFLNEAVGLEIARLKRSKSMRSCLHLYRYLWCTCIDIWCAYLPEHRTRMDLAHEGPDVAASTLM